MPRAAGDGTDMEQGCGSRFHRFQDLARHRVNRILLVSSAYDAFSLGEDGRLFELLLKEYLGFKLSHAPRITQVSGGREAVATALEQGPFDLVITTLHITDMHAVDLAGVLCQRGVTSPIVLLAYDTRELKDVSARGDPSCLDRMFLWQGDFRIFPTIVQYVEDRLNVEEDSRSVGVQSIILIDNDAAVYSSLLPIIHGELMRHTQQVMAEGINVAHRFLRLLARPKVLLCGSYEEARRYFSAYQETILGIIAEVGFPRWGVFDARAGVEFAREVNERYPDIPILLQSQNTDHKRQADTLGVGFLHKNSPTLAPELRRFIVEQFGFGDFEFRMPDGAVVDRARDIHELTRKIAAIPDECLLYHASKNHFSMWLKARTEFDLALQLRPRKVTPSTAADHVRQDLLSYLREYHLSQRQGAVVDFVAATFDPEDGFARIGGGSLGGKGRGLAFAATLLNTYRAQTKLDNVRICVPPTVVLGTAVFDDFLVRNGLVERAMREPDDREIERRFVSAQLPPMVSALLERLVDIMDYPLSVRSSSLLEDSQYQPFAGVYGTYILPNNHRDRVVRHRELQTAVKKVYASTFFHRAKTYINGTPYRLEEEKMGVIIQRLVGVRHGRRFYPDMSGVARSYNFYPTPPMKEDDGIVAMAFGFGDRVVEGATAFYVCPRQSGQASASLTLKESYRYAQKEFSLLEIPDPEADADRRDGCGLVHRNLVDAADNNLLQAAAATYITETGDVVDGLSSTGEPFVTCVRLLKSGDLPLLDIIDGIMHLGRHGMNAHVEIEFAANLSVPPGRPKEVCLLQMRPMVLRLDRTHHDISEVSPEGLLCKSSHVIGGGIIDSVRDIVVVNKDRFDRARSLDAAREIAALNAELTAENLQYLLVGIGRWGSTDSWLGIPVGWDDISGARAIVETAYEDIPLVPSQGAHFFQYLTAFEVGYFTVDSRSEKDFIDWRWLSAQQPVGRGLFVDHVSFDRPLKIIMNAGAHEGIIIKPPSS